MGKVKGKKVITRPSRLVPLGLGGGTDNPKHPSVPSPTELRHVALVKQQVKKSLVFEKIKSQRGGGGGGGGGGGVSNCNCKIGHVSSDKVLLKSTHSITEFQKVNSFRGVRKPSLKMQLQLIMLITFNLVKKQAESCCNNR